MKIMNAKRGSAVVSISIVIALIGFLIAPQAAVASKVSKKDFQAYMSSVRSLVSAENSILRKYGSVTGENYTDDETMYVVLTDLTGEINRFITRLERIQPKNSTLRSAHNIYIQGWNLQFEAMLLTLEALEDQSYAGMARSNKVLAQGRAKISEYRARIQKLG
jgi:dynactin complex subunit